MRSRSLVLLQLGRVYDIAGCNEGLSVELNGQQLPSTFAEYVRLYVHAKQVNRNWNMCHLYSFGVEI